MDLAFFVGIRYNKNNEFSEENAMLTAQELQAKLAAGPLILDGATGSNLMKAGMPRGCCTEEWVLNNPEPLRALQQAYREAGSDILYAPTFQAQPIALKRVDLDKQTEAVNAALVALTRSAAEGALVAGNLTTLAVYMDSFDEANFDELVENYRRQIHGLLDRRGRPAGGGDPDVPHGGGSHPDGRRIGRGRGGAVHLHHAVRRLPVLRSGGRTHSGGTGPCGSRRRGLQLRQCGFQSAGPCEQAAPVHRRAPGL